MLYFQPLSCELFYTCTGQNSYIYIYYTIIISQILPVMSAFMSLRLNQNTENASRLSENGADHPNIYVFLFIQIQNQDHKSQLH